MITVKYLCQHSHLLQNDGKNLSVAGLWSQCYTIIRFIIFIVSYCNLLKFNCNLKYHILTNIEFSFPLFFTYFWYELTVYLILIIWLSYSCSDGASRRKNATRETTSTLKAWLQEHQKNPYPTKGEKIMLAIITRMTLTQVGSCKIFDVYREIFGFCCMIMCLIFTFS